MSLAIEQPLHSCISPSKVTPIFLTVLQGPLVSMGVRCVGVVDVNGGTAVAELRPGRNCSIGIFINECTGAIRRQNVQSLY